MTERRLSVLLAAALFALTLVMYWQTTAFDFVNYDDHRYVYENPRVLAGLNAANVQWAFTTFEFSNWHPLTWLNLMLDASVLGAGPRSFHFTNALLHAINAALLMLLMTRLTGAVWRSALVAGLFALHPLHVESVAWVSSRKDVLSMAFGLLAMLAYVQFCHARAAQPGRSREGVLAYVVVLTCFALSLMSKPMLVTLPFTLLLLDGWPLQRARIARDWIGLVIEKLPLLAMSVASSLVTIAAQSAGGAVRDAAQVSITARLANAITAYATYLRQTVWPADLAVFYPYPQSISLAEISLAAIVLIAITIACVFAARRKFRAPLVGWLWFLGTLVPMMGLVQVGAASHADRYTYFPLIGVLIMFSWLLPAARPAQAKWSGIAATTCMLALAAVCWFQIGYWRDSITLAARALSVTSENATAHTLMGEALTSEGGAHLEEAIAHLQEATRIDPNSPQAWHNLGFAYAQAAMNEQAMDAYRRAIALRPDFAENHYNMGLLLKAAGKRTEARRSLERAAELAIVSGNEKLAALAKEAMN